MRFVTKVMAAIVVLPAVLPQTPATALPCDNTRWCAEYAPSMGSTNCDFFTIEQCRETVSGIGGFCVPKSILQSVWACGPPQLSVSSLLKKEPQPCRLRGSSGFHPGVEPECCLSKISAFTRYGNNKIGIKRSHQ